jgi:vitamin B12 transporter
VRSVLLYIILLTTIPSLAQISLNEDTIKIREVVINGKREILPPAGFKTITLDSSIIKNYDQRTVAEILAENSCILIKSYGMGGVATPSFRGTGASHTQITWNGININHPMLGQSDLSLLPSGMSDNIQIYFGGASLILNSGGIGGAIDLENKPTWNKETSIKASPGVGSFGTYSGLLSVKSGSSSLQTVTKAFFQTSENDFRYLNSESGAEPVWETRKNSQVQQRGFMQELYFKKSNNTASARIWYQSARRNLPSSLLTQQAGLNENQFDESLRVMLNYDVTREKQIYSFTGALIQNRLNYSNNLASVESRNLSDMWTVKAAMENNSFRNIRIKLVLSEEIDAIISNNYSSNKTRNTTTITASAKQSGAGRFGSLLLIRGILDRNKLMIPDFSAGIQFRILDLKEYYLKANISRNSKIPSMNDLFWSPGGNPDLKNEYSYISEFTYEMQEVISSQLKIDFNLSGFNYTIKDMIQWHPGEYSYWTADNIQSVNSSGLESSLSLNYKNNNITSGITGNYSYTRTTDKSPSQRSADSKGKQLIYIPENMFNASMHFSYRSFYTLWDANMTGKRYITLDNSRYLPGYFINSITTGVTLRHHKNLIDLNFRIDNIFAVIYQTIAYYPLPGRSYSMKIIFQLSK